MTSLQRITRAGFIALPLVIAGACAQAGALGDILGGVLGGGAQSAQVAGTIRGVDPNNQQLSLQQSNGQTVALAFDGNTKVVYQSRNYPVTALERGDEVTARVQQLQNGGYYTDSVFVTQSVTSASSGGSVDNVQSLQGTVRMVDRNSGQFQLEAGTGVILTVSLPYNVNNSDLTRFNNLRIGDTVRFYGVYLNNSRVELRQFY